MVPMLPTQMVLQLANKVNGVGGVGGIYVISDAVGVGAGDIISGGADTFFLCVLAYQEIGSKTLSF